MKFPVYNCLTSLRVLAVSIFTSTAFVQNSDAAIVMSFDESGSNVIATISGSVDLTGLTRAANDNASFRGYREVGASTIMALGILGDGGSYDDYFGGSFVSSGYNMLPTLDSIVESFGYSGSTIYMPGSVPLNGIYTPSPGMSFTWVGQSLSSIGLGALTSTPLTVWNNPNAVGSAGAIQLVAIPEPSSGLLAILSCAVLIRRRR